MDDLHNFFWRQPWCPLFGTLPDAELPFYHPVSQYCDIIREARSLWGVIYDDFTYDSNWPDVKEIEDYPAEKVLAARHLFSGFRHIDQYAAVDEYGTARESLNVNLKIEDALTVARNLLSEDLTRVQIATGKEAIKRWTENIPDYAIVAVLVIRETQYAISYLIDDDLPARAHERAGVAYDLLRQAQNKKSEDEKEETEEVISQKNDEVEVLKPLAKKWEKQLYHLSSGGKARSEEFEEKRLMWEKEAEYIRAKRANKEKLSKRAIAKIIAKKTGDKIETIRRHI